MDPEERLDLLVHAALQGPAGTRVHVVGGPGSDRRRLEMLGRAGRLDVSFDDEYHAEDGDVVVYPSPRNARDAVIRPEDAQVRVSLARWPTPPMGEERTFSDLVEGLYDGEPSRSASAEHVADGALDGHRVVVVANIPTHYRVPLFDEVAAHVVADGGGFVAAFLGDPYARRSWMVPGTGSYDSITVPSIGLPLTREWHPFVPTGLGRVLERLAPTVVVSGGFSPAVSGVAARFAARRGVPFGVWSGETALTGSGRAGWRRGLRRWVLRRASFGLAYGHGSGEYLRACRPDLPVAYVRNSTPVPGGPVGATPGTAVRILTVADMSSPRKGVDMLIDALAALGSRPWSLTVVGGGPYLGAMRERARALGDRVRFTGAMPSDRVAEAYRSADMFALASREELFGLVLVEAMGAGLATLASDRAGATADLCVTGRNSLVVSPNTVQAWRKALGTVIDDPGLRARLGRAARETISRRWSIERSASAFVTGLRLGVLSGAPR
jgi:glycosyltransferase involved in cell wall biosynthesis